MKNQIEQGSVIYGIKSQKYPSSPCYGVIITARCDIAQRKVPKYYYLEAVDATSWFYSKYGYQQVYSTTIKNKRDRICTLAQELELDGTTLLSKSSEEVRIILDDKKQQLTAVRNSPKKVDTLAKFIDEYIQIAQIDSDDIHRKQAIQKNSKSAISYLKDIRFLYKGIIINHNKKPSQPTLKRRFFKKKAAFFHGPVWERSGADFILKRKGEFF